MTIDPGFDRRLQSVLHEVLDQQVGPHPVWAESPAARRVADLARQGRLGRWPIRLLAFAAVLVVGGAVIAGVLRRETTPPLPRPTANGWVVFAANGEAGPSLEGQGGSRGASDIYIVREGVPPRLIVGQAGDALIQWFPAFSPDGARLAYTELDLSGVAPTQAPQPAGASPQEEAPSAGAPSWTFVVVEMGSDGVPGSVVARIAAESSLASGPEWSPEGRSLAYVAATSEGRHQLWLVGLDGSATRLGPEVDLLNNVNYGAVSTGFDWSPDGSTIALLDDEQLWLVPADGGAPRSLPGGNFRTVAWSPDGTMLAVGTGSALRVMAADGTAVSDIDMGATGVDDPAFAWSSDGRWIAWADGSDIVRVHPDGSGGERHPSDVGQLLDALVDGEPYRPPVSVVDWSIDGERLVLEVGGPDQQGAIVSFSWDPHRPSVVLVKPTFACCGDTSWQEVQE